jgi:hypothetical protein
MTREILQAVLRGAPGVSEKSGAYRVASEHRATLYLGTDGRGMVVQEVEGLKLHDTHVQITSHELGEVFASYDSVHALAIKPPKESGPQKTGFA